MKALILAGGKGTRLRPLTVYTPKPIVPVINRPFLVYQIEILKRAGIEDITLSLNYQPDKIRHLLGDGADLGVELNCVTEPSPMGTGGAFRYAAGDSRETTVVLNGDILTDLVVQNLLANHFESKAAATICLTGVEDPSTFGLVKVDKENKVLGFLEKPKSADISNDGPNLINAGIYVLEPEVLDLIPPDTNHSFEYDVFPTMLAKEMAFNAHVLDNEYWCDIGTVERYLTVHLDFMAGKVRRFDIGGKADSAEIATSAKIDNRSVIGDDCIIKPGVSITNSVLGTGVHVEEKAVIKDSVIWAHSRISNSAKIEGTVIAKGCYVGKNASVGNGSVLGDKTSLTDYTKV